MDGLYDFVDAPLPTAPEPSAIPAPTSPAQSAPGLLDVLNLPPGASTAAVQSPQPQPVPVTKKGRVYVKGLEWFTTDAAVTVALSRFGKVDNIDFVTDLVSGKSLGAVTATFADSVIFLIFFSYYYFNWAGRTDHCGNI